MFERIAAGPSVPPDVPKAAALELGLRFERMAVAYWEEITTDGSGTVTTDWAP